MTKQSVSIVKYRKNHDTVRNALELCDGFKELKANDKVLIKPNIVLASNRKKIPLYGVVTTTRVLEEIIILLREYGCTDITIGEGSPYHKELNLSTLNGYQSSGLTRVAEKYGINLVDFNNGEFKNVDLGPTKIKLAREALESDFLINVPVLKTHMQAMVSLNLKNLKGCLKQSSKMKFHKVGLDEMIARLNMVLKPKLNIIDGIYSIERGPGISGRAYRTNLIIASRDAFSGDIVGTTCLGIDPLTVEYFSQYSDLAGQPLNLQDIEIKGVSIDDVIFPLEWKMREAEQIMADYDIKGATFQWPGNTLCTNCAIMSDTFMGVFLKDNKGSTFDSIEFVLGDKVRPHKASKQVFLMGDCAVRNNSECDHTVKIRGCPVGVGDSVFKVYNHTLGKSKRRKLLALRMLKGMAEKLGVYEETFPRPYSYDMPDFDQSFYR
ncbi:MAG: DUF362 domain-containing protein [Proteobacteria bacterium]|nr:DUF362 domain-containing protein [Pseudomonadota bacterium]MBU1583913.1 DUF362 domain-containing protein [Pseudomonadota bacterium]MBU2452816.1 DUF362 domain-containing protein [Pseudomonadota bacterium]MBU2627079.1 DUF362 domain-containing protein [Pseudomonadota bacterium]